MIIACSMNVFNQVKAAKQRRIAKGDARPLLVDEKRLVSKVRSALAKEASADALVWNLDLVEAPVSDGADTIGIVVTGYLYQRDAQFTVVLNSLDDADLCRIGELAHEAIRAAFADCRICPNVTDAYLACVDELGEKVADACGMKFEFAWQRPRDKTLVIPNASRRAAGGLTRARHFHEVFLFGGGGARVSHEPFDHYAMYRLNERRVEYANVPAAAANAKSDGITSRFAAESEEAKTKAKRMSHPFIEMRELAGRFSSADPIPALELRLGLYEDRYLYRHHELTDASDVPECSRTVLVPFDAPLSWLHEVIQKAFNWYDYHLHSFTFRDYGVRESFEDLFEAECGIERFGADEAPTTLQTRYRQSGGRERFWKLTGLDEKWVLRVFAPYAESELVHEDFPVAALPETMPVGLALFGSERYEAVMGTEHAVGEWARILRRNDPRAAEVQKSADAFFAKLRPDDAIELCYNYDFGDDWHLAVGVVRLLKAKPVEMPRVTAAVGHTPPEDCGGLGGYGRVLQAYDLMKAAECGELADGPDDAAAAGPHAGDGFTAFFGYDVADDEDLASADDLEEAQDLIDWARNAVGWVPLDEAPPLEETFDHPGRM